MAMATATAVNMETLYADNRLLLRAMASKWAGRCALDRAVDTEDLMQAGFFGLLRANESFDPEAGKSWASWAAWFIRREFENTLGLREGKSTRAHTAALPLDAPLPTNDGDDTTGTDLLADDSLPEIDSGALLADLQENVRRAVDELPNDRERRVVQLCDLEDKPLRTAAAALQVSTERARQIRKRALHNLREDKRLRALADEKWLDERTRFHAHKGVTQFRRDLTSTTEAAALWRIEQRQRLEAMDEALTDED